MASRALKKVLEALSHPDTKRVRLHGPAAGFYFWPHGDAIATSLLERDDIQPFDPGLPGFDSPQSWKQGNWRTWAR